jgi:hypothetical protein
MKGGEDVLLPTALLRDILDVDDLYHMQKDHFSSAPPSVQSIHKKLGPSPIWGRLKALEPKANAALRQLLDEQGRVIDDPVQVERMVRTTRGFWDRKANDLLRLSSAFHVFGRWGWRMTLTSGMRGRTNFTAISSYSRLGLRRVKDKQE